MSKSTKTKAKSARVPARAFKLAKKPVVKKKESKKVTSPAPVVVTNPEIKTHLNHNLRELFYVERVLLPAYDSFRDIVRYQANSLSPDAPFYTRMVANHLQNCMPTSAQVLLDDFAEVEVLRALPPLLTLGEMEMLLDFVILFFQSRANALEASAFFGMQDVYVPYPIPEAA
jgi:hypothetical protein